MKKYLFIFLLSAFVNVSASAQEVFNLVLENATRIINTPGTNFTQTRIAQFKQTSLLYIRRKAFELSKDVPADFLNTQAYYLSEFITLFFNEMVKNNKLPEDKRKEQIFMFMDASITHPLFHDPDEETTLSYIKEGTELTPFSLDTDWEQAYRFALEKLKEKKGK